MAGHSKWHNIQRTKGVQDAKRQQTFAKLSHNIYVAAKFGGDPELNPILKDVIDRAKSFSLPGDKIQNAINRATGQGGKSEILFENTYEFYGYGGRAAFLIDCETDNPNRTYNDLRDIIGKNGGKMVSEGSISWNFTQRAKFEIVLKNNSEEGMLGLMELDGVEDVDNIDGNNIILLAKKEAAQIIKEFIDSKKEVYQIKDFELVKLANNTIDLSDEEKSKNKELLELLEEEEGVIGIWSNINN